jgi:hypothetical protein
MTKGTQYDLGHVKSAMWYDDQDESSDDDKLDLTKDFHLGLILNFGNNGGIDDFGDHGADGFAFPSSS